MTLSGEYWARNGHKLISPRRLFAELSLRPETYRRHDIFYRNLYQFFRYPKCKHRHWLNLGILAQNQPETSELFSSKSQREYQNSGREGQEHRDNDFGDTIESPEAQGRLLIQAEFRACRRRLPVISDSERSGIRSERGGAESWFARPPSMRSLRAEALT